MIPEAATSSMDPLVRAIISIGVLVFISKLFANIASTMKLTTVLGEIIAGILFGPYFLGGAITIYGEPLVVLNEYVYAFAEVGAIMVLFSAGVGMGYTRLKSVGIWAALIAIGGGALPFAVAYFFYSNVVGVDSTASMIMSTAFIATSVAISVRMMEDLGYVDTMLGDLLVNSAVIDDVVGVIVLGMVTATISSGMMGLSSIMARVAAYSLLWVLMLEISIYVVPKILDQRFLMEHEGGVESVAVSIGFIMAALSGALGLSPVVGAYTAGLAVGESRVIHEVKQFSERMEMFFGSLFFSVVGAMVDINVLLDPSVTNLTLILSLLALASKTFGAATPAMLKLKDVKSSLCLGMGMTPRGEMGLVVATTALKMKAIGEWAYAQIVGMVLVTTFLAPILMMKFCAINRCKCREKLKE